MSLSRYEEILIRLVAAEVARSGDLRSADSQSFRRAAAYMENHFQERDLASMQERGTLPALLKRQAE